MKRFKKVFILLGLLLVATIVTLIVMKTEETKEKIQNTEAIILSVDSDDVTSLAWEYEDISYAFRKEAGVWYWEDDADFPVREESIEALLSVFNEFGASFEIEDVEDYKQYGLETPTCTITLGTAEATYTITLGDYSTMDAERYVSVGDGKVYLVQSDPMDTYEVSVSDLIQLDVIPTISNVTAITFDGAQNYTLSYEEESDRSFCSSDCYYTEQKGKTVALDTDRVVSYYTTVNQLDLSDYVSYNVTEEELAAWGLDDPELSVTIDYTEADAEGEEEARTFCLHIGRNQEELAAKEEAEAAGEAYSGSVTAYVRVDGSSIVYAISESDYEALTAASYNDLRHQKVLTADFASIRQMDITLDGNVYTITIASSDDASDDEELTYFYNGEEISISNIQSAWQNLSIQSFTEETPSAKKEIGFVLTMNDEKATTISVVLYRYNGTLCLAAVDGETVGFISRSAAVSLIEAIYALILG